MRPGTLGWLTPLLWGREAASSRRDVLDESRDGPSGCEDVARDGPSGCEDVARDGPSGCEEACS